MKSLTITLLLLVSAMTASAQDSTFNIRGSVGELKATVSRPKLEKGKKCPLVVILHGFTGNRNEVLLTSLSNALVERGVATVRFDFNGHGESEGLFEHMTIRNEIDDAKAVIACMRRFGWVGDIAVAGHSQGGVISTMVAGELGSDSIVAAALYAPAANIIEDSKRGMLLGTRFDAHNLPEILNVWNHRVGRAYLQVAQTLPIYETADGYKGNVMVFHGTGDTAVPSEFGKRLSEHFPNATLRLLPGDGHGFGRSRNQVVTEGAEFLANQLKNK